MKICALLALLFLTGCATARTPRIAEYALRIDMYGGVCSGTAVGPNLVLTATHCLDKPVLAIDGQAASVLKRIDDGKDHSLISVSVKFKRWAKVGGRLLQGDRVRWVGNPAGQDDVYREGYVARSYASEVWVMAAAYGGDSGSGVFCDNGQVCGVVSAGKAWSHGPFTFTPMVMYPLAFKHKDWIDISIDS